VDSWNLGRLARRMAAASWRLVGPRGGAYPVAIGLGELSASAGNTVVAMSLAAVSD
jgi:hypothetical protein